ncbi:hypothetical protein C8R43DRAFT_950571 [Mycena crocata]|nr:hypothetical protein C8R43DRAFT_950571 [Mycena crocata]
MVCLRTWLAPWSAFSPALHLLAAFSRFCRVPLHFWSLFALAKHLSLRLPPRQRANWANPSTHCAGHSHLAHYGVLEYITTLYLAGDQMDGVRGNIMVCLSDFSSSNPMESVVAFSSVSSFLRASSTFLVTLQENNSTTVMLMTTMKWAGVGGGRALASCTHAIRDSGKLSFKALVDRFDACPRKALGHPTEVNVGRGLLGKASALRFLKLPVSEVRISERVSLSEFIALRSRRGRCIALSPSLTTPSGVTAEVRFKTVIFSKQTDVRPDSAYHLYQVHRYLLPLVLRVEEKTAPAPSYDVPWPLLDKYPDPTPSSSHRSGDPLKMLQDRPDLKARHFLATVDVFVAEDVALEELLAWVTVLIDHGLMTLSSFYMTVGCLFFVTVTHLAVLRMAFLCDVSQGRNLVVELRPEFRHYPEKRVDVHAAGLVVSGDEGVRQQEDCKVITDT